VRILQLRTDSDPESLGGARRQVRDAATKAGLAPEAARNLEVAVGEALANVHQHAYASHDGPVSVEVLTATGGLTVVVSDEGQATTAPVIPATLPSPSTAGGRGLYLVQRLVDDVEIGVNSAGHGVTVRMTARLQSGVAQPSGSHGGVERLPAQLRVEESPPASNDEPDTDVDQPGTPEKEAH